MNKEEIEKLLKINETIITSEQCKEHRTLKNDERVLLMNNIKIKDYIQELEFQNTALKAEHNHNITRIKELEQKESILDKVKDKLKEDIEKFNNLRKTKEMYSPSEERLSSKYFYAQEILNSMEGEKKQ